MTVDPQLVAGALLLLVLTVSPGADMALVAATALRRGRRAAFWTTLGITSGLPFHAAASALGLAAILAASAEAFTVAKFVGAIYLAWLGVHAIRHSGDAPPPVSGPASPVDAFAAYRRGLLSNLLNPKVAIFYLTFVPQFISPGQDVLARSLLFAGIHAAWGIAWLVLYAYAIDRLGVVFARRGVRGWLERVTGVVLMGLGVRLAFTER